MWINFNDRLPDKKTPVLAWCPEHGSMFIVELYQAGDEYALRSGAELLKQVATHWRPLPLPSGNKETQTVICNKCDCAFEAQMRTTYVFLAGCSGVGRVADLVGKSVLLLRPELVRKFMIIKPLFDKEEK